MKTIKGLQVHCKQKTRYNITIIQKQVTKPCDIGTVGRINFEDKKFRGYLLNLEIKYPCNFLYIYTRLRFFV